MSTTKKLAILFFTVALVINLQFSSTLSSGMDNGFSIEQLAENIFLPTTLAAEVTCSATSGCGHVSCTGSSGCQAWDHEVTCENETFYCSASH